MNFSLLPRLCRCRRTSIRSTLFATGLASLILAPAPTLAQTSLTVHGLDAHSLHSASQRAATGDGMTIDSITLFDGPLSSVQVERFEVLTPDAQVFITDENGTYSVAPPDTSHWRGHVVGDPDSMVYLAIDGDGLAKGLVRTDGRIFAVGHQPGDESSTVRQVEDTALREARSEWHCSNDDPVHRSSQAHRALEEGELSTLFALPGQGPDAQSLEGLLARSQRSGETYAAEVAVETDYEFYALFGNQSAASAYVATLFGGIATMYSSELDAQLLVSDIYLYTNGAGNDPWNATDTINSLYEVRNYWWANRTGVVRDTVHLLSGKRLGGGVAYVGVMACSNYAYGMTANIDGNYNPSSPSMIWDFVAVAHEIGHNFGTGHTHDIESYNPVVDSCYGGNPSTVPPDGGTIMSYCHLRPGGMSNINPYFGRVGHYGYQSERVNAKVLAHLAYADNAGCLPDPVATELDFQDDFETGSTSAWN